MMCRAAEVKQFAKGSLENCFFADLDGLATELAFGDVEGGLCKAARSALEQTGMRGQEPTHFRIGQRQEGAAQKRLDMPRARIPRGEGKVLQIEELIQEHRIVKLRKEASR